MLKRKMEKVLYEYYKNDSDKILLVEGARQVGKSYIIRETAKSYFKNYLEINLLADYEGNKIFRDVHSLSDFYLAVGSIEGNTLSSYEDSIIFLDEIQQYPHLLTLLKPLREDKRFRYIASGSELRIALKTTLSIPMGSVEIVDMYPLDFEEFLWANGINEDFIRDLRDSLFVKKNIISGVHNRMMQLFKLYLLIGGLPEAVSAYLDNNNLVQVRKIHETIMKFYELDCTRYQEDKKLRIIDIYRHIPSFMVNKKKRVVFKELGAKRSADLYEEIDYLIQSGIALEVEAISTPEYPLNSSISKNLLKLYLNDVGLLSARLFKTNIKPIMADDLSINLGAVYETVVAEELKAHSHPLCYYDNKARGEVDFLLEDVENLSLLPIEVKSGRNYKIHSAISSFLKIPNYNIKRAYVLSNSGEIEDEGPVFYLPIYAVMYF